MKTVKRSTQWLGIGISLLLLLIAPTFAQINEPIVIGDNKVGQVTAANVAPSFQYNATVAETLFVQALTISDGFIPQVIVKRDNVAIQTISNQGGVSVAEGNVDVTPGLYVFEVQGVNGTQGQFVLSLQPGQEQPATPLVANEPTRVEVNASTPQVRYSFNDPAVTTLRLSVDKSTGLGGASVEVRDAQNDNLLALFGFGADGEVVIPTGITNISITVNYSGEFPTEDVTLLLRTDDASVIPPETTSEAIVEACTVSPQNSAVNIRQSNSTQAPIMGILNRGDEMLVIGKVEDGSWYQVEGGGFVAASVVPTNGDCEDVSVVTPPPFTPVVTTSPNTPPAPTLPPIIGSDQDNDGVEDGLDGCPQIPGLPEFNGCPPPVPGEPDEDGDGFTGDLEVCPEVPGTIYGCPNVDSDGDGLVDHAEDYCPNEPGPAEMIGCPNSDGDWLPDIGDDCPSIPADTYNGCPEDF